MSRECCLSIGTHKPELEQQGKCLTSSLGTMIIKKSSAWADLKSSVSTERPFGLVEEQPTHPPFGEFRPAVALKFEVNCKFAPYLSLGERGSPKAPCFCTRRKVKALEGKKSR